MRFAAILVGVLAGVVSLFLFAASIDPLNGRAFKKEALRRVIEKLKNRLARGAKAPSE
jgi:hypothetical protein